MNKSNEEKINNTPISTEHNYEVLKNIRVCLHRYCIEYDETLLYGDRTKLNNITLEYLEELYKKLIRLNLTEVLDYFINNIEVPDSKFWNELLNYCVLTNKKEIIIKNFYLFVNSIGRNCYDWSINFSENEHVDPELEALYKRIKLKAIDYVSDCECYVEEELEKLLGMWYRPNFELPTGRRKTIKLSAPMMEYKKN